MNTHIAPGRPRATQIIPTVVALAASYPLLRHFGDLKVAELPLQMLTGPVAMVLGAVLLGQILTFFLTGPQVRVIKNNLMLMIWSLAIVPVLTKHPSLKMMAPLEQPLIWLIAVYAVYRIANAWVQESDILETALQITALTTAALLLSRLLPIVWPTGRLTLKLPTGTVAWSINQAIVFALIMVAAFRSASLIRLAENKLMRLVGDALKNSALFQFICFSAIFIYSHDLRPTLAKRYADRLGLLEWGAAALILALTFKRLSTKMKKLPDGVTVDQLARHLQDVRVTSDDELTMVAKLMSAFVEHGDRSGIATYLIAEAARLNVSTANIQQMAARLLQHRDPNIPRLTSHLEGVALERRNREQRLVLLQSTVKEFGEIVTMTTENSKTPRHQRRLGGS